MICDGLAVDAGCGTAIHRIRGEETACKVAANTRAHEHAKEPPPAHGTLHVVGDEHLQVELRGHRERGRSCRGA